MPKRVGFLLGLSVLLLCGVESASAARFSPTPRPFSDALASQLRVPPGFRINVFARNQGHARMMLTLPDGRVLLSRYNDGLVVALNDRNADGVSDEAPVVATIPTVHGLAFRDNTVYMASETRLFKMSMGTDGSFGTPTEFATLPPGGWHPRRTLGFDSAGWLYVSVGSSCNSCFDPVSPEYATIVRMKPDGNERSVFARGLRNTIGFDWHPDTGQLWGMDNGSDNRGDNIPAEELNLIEEGRDYGWPSCFGKQRVDRISRRDESIPAKDCSETAPAIRGYPAHSAPLGFTFYSTGPFPLNYQTNAYIAVHGSYNRSEPTGYKVVRIRFKNGKPTIFQDFAVGWLIENGRAQFGRPAGLTVTTDGSLLISDDYNGVVYRVSYQQRR